jgi:hypothetical protein
MSEKKMENEGKREVIWTNVDVGEAIFTSFFLSIVVILSISTTLWGLNDCFSLNFVFNLE